MCVGERNDIRQEGSPQKLQGGRSARWPASKPIYEEQNHSKIWSLVYHPEGRGCKLFSA